MSLQLHLPDKTSWPSVKRAWNIEDVIAWDLRTGLRDRDV